MLDREHMQVGRSTSMLHDGVVLAGIERHRRRRFFAFSSITAANAAVVVNESHTI